MNCDDWTAWNIRSTDDSSSRFWITICRSYHQNVVVHLTYHASLTRSLAYCNPKRAAEHTDRDGLLKHKANGASLAAF